MPRSRCATRGSRGLLRDVRLWRMAGLAQLARQDGTAAAEAFRHASAQEGTHGETHYNYGVALQMRGDHDEAARAYQLALACQPDLVAAQFNLGVLFQGQGATDAAVAAFSAVLEAEPRNVAAYKNLGEVLHAGGRTREWMANFRRFEAACPKALSLAVQALDVCQYRGDFATLERYLDGLAQGQYEASDETELVDGLEELLYLLLFFDVHPETMRQFAASFDAAARRVYGEPLAPVAARAPGRLRVGYLSADLRNHVMGKMMWSALRHHDKGRFELFFYSLSTESDEWTEKFRGLADRFATIAGLAERAAAQRIAADDLDLLVDLSTHTKGARPGILALKPARVQITHVASAGTVGLAAIDFKLTDRYADVPGNQSFQLETLLPMDGCVYPYRHVAPASAHPFRRDAFGVGPQTVVIGAFVHWRKLSRRCLALWRDVLTRIPRAKLAFSPLDPAARRAVPAPRRRGRDRGRSPSVPAAGPRRRREPGALREHRLRARSDAVWRRQRDAGGARHGGAGGHAVRSQAWGAQHVQHPRQSGRDADRRGERPAIRGTGRATRGRCGVRRRSEVGDTRRAGAIAAHGHGPAHARTRSGVRSGARAEGARGARRRGEELTRAWLRPASTAHVSPARRAAAWRRRRRSAAAHYALAEELDDAGDKAEAIASLQRALALHPTLAPAHRYLGILLAERRDYATAAASFERAIEIDPGHPRAWCNLGNAQRGLGRFVEAESAYRRALALQPDYPLAACNLALVQRDQGRSADAEATLRQSIARRPGDKPFAPALVALADSVAAARRTRRSSGVVRSCHRARARRQHRRRTWGSAMYWPSAETSTRRGPPMRTSRAGILQICAPSAVAFPHTADGVSRRHRAARGTGALRGRTDRAGEWPGSLRRGNVAADELLDGLQWSNFFLAYQGDDDRPLQARYAAFAARAIDRVNPAWRAPMASREVSGRRIRIGFASAFLHFGTVGQYFHSWITRLDRQAFEVFYYQLRPSDDSVIAAIRTRADRHRLCAGMNALPSRVAPVIRSDALDVLVYPELGMDATSFALAALRLAPRQYAGWGHPVTTGHATIDGFFTCDVMEPPGGDAHYTEPLVRLPGIGTAYPRMALPPAAPRAAFALPSGAPLLLCPQSMFKIHPDNDDLFARVVARSPGAILVLFAERHPSITDRFMRRLTTSFERHGLSIRERTRVLPRVSHEDYLRINLVCDLMLDTLHWSGGNTSLDALACGLPMVTLPGRFMRGRQSAGMLRLIGVPELIAADEGEYVRIVVELAGDAERRAGPSHIMRERAGLIFEDSGPLSALHAFLEAAVATRN